MALVEDAGVLEDVGESLLGSRPELAGGWLQMDDERVERVQRYVLHCLDLMMRFAIIYQLLLSVRVTVHLFHRALRLRDVARRHPLQTADLTTSSTSFSLNCLSLNISLSSFSP